MRLLFVSGEYPPLPGGLGDYTAQLAAALAQPELAAATFTARAGRYWLVAPTAAPLDLGPAPAQPWGWGMARVVRSAAQHFAADWLHIQYQTGAYAMHPAINLLPRALRRWPQRPKIAVTFHDLRWPYLFPKAGPLREYVNWRLARDADLVITTNPRDTAQFAAHGLAPHEIPIGSNIAPISVETAARAAWRSRAAAAEDDLLLGFFGLCSPTKGLDTLVEALAGQPWRLLIIGGEATAPADRAFRAQLQARIAALGLAERITWSGQLDAPEVSAALNAADLIALPFSDGASFRRGSLLAALAHQRPVLTTIPSDPATAEQLRHGEQSWLVPAGQPAALRAAIAELAASPGQRAALARAGAELAAHFGWPAIAAAHRSAYSLRAKV